MDSLKIQIKKTQQGCSNFSQMKDMLKKYVSKKRYSYVWDQLLKFYNRNQASMANFEALQCAKIGFYVYERLFYNYFRKKQKRKSVNQGSNLGNLDSRFKSLVAILGDCKNIILVQMHYQDPQYFNMFFRLESDPILKRVLGNKPTFQANLKNIKEKDIDPEKQLFILFRKTIKAACLLLICQIKHNSLQQILCLFETADSFIKNLPIKFFAGQIMSYQLLKFDVIETCSISPNEINLQYRFPVEIIYKIYQYSRMEKRQKALYLYKRCQRYIIMSLKHFELSRLDLRIVYKQFHLLHYSSYLPINPNFNQIIEFVGQKLNRELIMRQQITFIIKKYASNIKQYVNNQTKIIKYLDKTQQNQNRMKKCLSHNIQTNNNGVKHINKEFIIENILKIGNSLSKEKNSEKKGLIELYKKLRFNKIQILDQSSDQQGQIHGFEVLRRQRIASLNQKKEDIGSLLIDALNMEDQIHQISEETKKKQYFQQIHYLDDVVTQQINNKLKQSINYRSVNENCINLNQIKLCIKQLDRKRQNEVKLLREKSKNKFFNEIIRQQTIPRVNLTKDWIKSKPKPKLKILESRNQQFLKYTTQKEKVYQSKFKKSIMLSDSFDKLSKKLKFRFQANNCLNDQIM